MRVSPPSPADIEYVTGATVVSSTDQEAAL